MRDEVVAQDAGVSGFNRSIKRVEGSPAPERHDIPQYRTERRRLLLSLGLQHEGSHRKRKERVESVNQRSDPISPSLKVNYSLTR